MILFLYFIKFREIKNKIILIISFKRNIFIRDYEITRKLFLFNKRKINRVIFVIFEKRRRENVIFIIIAFFKRRARAIITKIRYIVIIIIIIIIILKIER